MQDNGKADAGEEGWEIEDVTYIQVILLTSNTSILAIAARDTRASSYTFLSMRIGWHRSSINSFVKVICPIDTMVLPPLRRHSTKPARTTIAALPG